MNAKKIISMTLVILLAFGAIFAMTGCKKTSEKYHPDAQEVTNLEGYEVGYQLEMPKDGDQIAIIHTTMGDITLRLFPEAAPKAVENFIALSEAGTYNGTLFHRVMNDFMIQTGDYEKGDGTGGKSTWDEAFEDEFTNKLFNIKGAVSMANNGVDSNGSQFFINTASPDAFDADAIDFDTMYDQMVDSYEMMKEYYGYQFYKSFKNADDYIRASQEEGGAGGIYPLSYEIPEEVLELYKKNGGNIHLDGAFRESGGHTVFAQVIDGFDVVDKIQKAAVDENNKPTTDIKITSIEITTYKAK